MKNVAFAFSLLDVSVAPSGLAQAFGECRKLMARINPEWVYYGQGEEDIHGIKVCWAEYSNNAVGNWKDVHKEEKIARNGTDGTKESDMPAALTTKTFFHAKSYI